MTVDHFKCTFIKTLFDPEEQSKIRQHQKLIKNTLQTLLSEIFFRDIEENQYLIEKFEEEHHL